MKTLYTLSQVESEVESGRSIVLFTKENCGMCNATKAAAEDLVKEFPEVKVFQVPVVQEQNQMNDRFLPRGKFMFPVVHSFQDGNHVRGTTGARSTRQLMNSWVPVPAMKCIYYEMVSKNRSMEDELRRDIDGHVPLGEIKIEEVAPINQGAPSGDPLEDGCDSCQ